MGRTQADQADGESTALPVEPQGGESRPSGRVRGQSGGGSGTGKSHVQLSALQELPVEDQRFALLILKALGQAARERGSSEDEVRRLVYRLLASADMQRTRAVAVRNELAKQLVPSIAEFDPIPHATLRQASRLAALKASLLSKGAYPVSALAEARGTSPNTIRQWLHRARNRHELFTVSHDRETLVPAFLLDESLEPKHELQESIRSLREVGEDGWALWAWFVLPSAALGDQSPSEIAEKDPDLVSRLARSRAAEAA